MKYEAFCTNCDKVIDKSKDVPDGHYTQLLMSAQFKRCPDCHKNQDFAYYQIDIREVKTD